MTETSPVLGVLASGGGSNLGALLDAHARGDLPAPVGVVISNNSGSGALARARERGIPALHISGHTHDDAGQAILAALRHHKVSVIVLAGYMKLLAPAVLDAFPGHVLNIHPGPLPQFGGQGMYGDHVHKAVLESGAAHSGPTVHLVDGNYDEGPVLRHQTVAVEPDDTVETLAKRVLAAEHELYWRAIRDRFCA